LTRYYVNSPKPSIDRTFQAVFPLSGIAPKRHLIKIGGRQYRNPVYLAKEWQNDLDKGKYRSRADLAHNLGVSRARVTQILNLLTLPKDAIETAFAMGDPLASPTVTERKLRFSLKNRVRDH
jgi:hypothetical protein